LYKKDAKSLFSYLAHKVERDSDGNDVFSATTIIFDIVPGKTRHVGQPSGVGDNHTTRQASLPEPPMPACGRGALRSRLAD
jgi:hypothetical protein